jgi:hypothetical protein
MKTYELWGTISSDSNHVWGFDFGKGLIGQILKDKTGKDNPRRFCLRNAFDQVYPHGG